MHWITGACTGLLWTGLLSRGSVVTLMTGGMGLVEFLHQTGSYLLVTDSSGRLSPVSFCQPLTHWQKQLSFPCCLSVGAPNLAASRRSRMKCPIKRYDAGQVGTPVSSQLFARLPVSMCLYFHSCSSQVCFDSDIERSRVFCLCLRPSVRAVIYLSIHPFITVI